LAPTPNPQSPIPNSLTLIKYIYIILIKKINK